MNLIKIEQLVLKKKNSLILNQINLSLNAGQSYLLYGKNGAGKTSLLRCVTGMESSYNGQISYDYKEPAIRIVTYLPDSYSLSDRIQVGSYIHSFKLLLESNDLFDNYLYKLTCDSFNIDSYRDKNFGSLSKGMLKRVFITLTMMKKSRVLILDEPFEGLDIAMKKVLLDILLNEVVNGKLLLVSSHEVAEIYTSFDQLIGIKGGEIISTSNKGEISDYRDLIHQII